METLPVHTRLLFVKFPLNGLGVSKYVERRLVPDSDR